MKVGIRETWRARHNPPSRWRRASLMTQVAVIAKLTAVEGKSEDVAAAIAELVTQVRDAEPGTLVYAAAQDTADSNVFWFYEFYGSAEAATTHSTGDALANA